MAPRWDLTRTEACGGGKAKTRKKQQLALGTRLTDDGDTLEHRSPSWRRHRSALYQLHLVKAATARAFVPKELRLVEAFGYTLGGMFLARYHDSPAGQFDEVIVVIFIPCLLPRFPVRFPDELCFAAGGDRRHCVEPADFLREVGLPSHVAAFSETEACALRNKPNNFLNILGMSSGFSKQENYRGIEISETSGSSSRHLCNISLPLNEASRGSYKRNKWMGPAIKMSLPSFSGQTEDHPELLKYSCKVECRVRPVSPAKIWSPKTAEPEECSDGRNNSTGSDSDAQRQSLLVLLSRPILALEFSSLRMHVDAPKIVAPHPKKKEVRYSSST
uniref:Uncharacterized protein n=1 Tax=Aegilops tauschii TaxID=37682 RepID=M8AQV0_AEGTA